MVLHPSEDFWSSYRYNAPGQPNDLVTPHLVCNYLDRTVGERQAAYCQLFKHRISNNILDVIREAINKAWVLGDDQFRRRTQKKLERRVEPSANGGDKKSEKFKINRV